MKLGSTETLKPPVVLSIELDRTRREALLHKIQQLDESRIADMDASGIDITLLSTNDPGPECFGDDGVRAAVQEAVRLEVALDRDAADDAFGLLHHR